MDRALADAPPAVAWFEIVGPRYFELFGTGTARGRYPADDGAAADREVLLSHDLWTRRGADPAPSSSANPRRSPMRRRSGSSGRSSAL